MNRKKKKTKTSNPSFAYTDAEDRVVTLKFNNSNWGNIHLLMGGAQEHLGMENLTTVKQFVDEAIAFYFDTLNRAVAKNMHVKAEAAKAQAAKEAEGDSGTEVVDTSTRGDEPQEASDNGTLADSDEGSAETTGTNG